MREQLTSHDVEGKLINPRTEKLFTRTDPLGYRRDFRYEFDLDVMDAIETESQMVTRVGDQTLHEGSTYNDYYGFATSPRSAEKGAVTQMERLAGAAVDVVVVTTVTSKPVFIDPYETASYVGNVRCFYVPYFWWPQDDPQRKLGWTKTFEVWKNGGPGADKEAFDALVAEMTAKDVGEPYRTKRKTA